MQRRGEAKQEEALEKQLTMKHWVDVSGVIEQMWWVYQGCRAQSLWLRIWNSYMDGGNNSLDEFLSSFNVIRSQTASWKALVLWHLAAVTMTTMTSSATSDKHVWIDQTILLFLTLHKADMLPSGSNRQLVGFSYTSSSV